jgi:hypothetical protein
MIERYITLTVNVTIKEFGGAKAVQWRFLGDEGAGKQLKGVQATVRLV